MVEKRNLLPKSIKNRKLYGAPESVGLMIFFSSGPGGWQAILPVEIITTSPAVRSFSIRPIIILKRSKNIMREKNMTKKRREENGEEINWSIWRISSRGNKLQFVFLIIRARFAFSRDRSNNYTQTDTGTQKFLLSGKKKIYSTFFPGRDSSQWHLQVIKSFSILLAHAHFIAFLFPRLSSTVT